MLAWFKNLFKKDVTPVQGPATLQRPCVIVGTDSTEYCSCPDWLTCGCGNQPPHHCMYCCLDLSPEQLKLAEAKGDILTCSLS